MSPFLLLHDPSALDPRHMRDVRRQLLRTVRCQHPVVPAARSRQRTPQFLSRTCIETVEHFIEQQHACIARECASDQRQPALAVRQRQHVSSSQARQTESLQHAGHALPLRARGLRQRNVFVEQAGRHDLRDREVPAVAHIFVLALRADIGDLRLVQLDWFAARVRSASATRRRAASSAASSCPSRSGRAAPSARPGAKRSRSRRARGDRPEPKSNAQAR